MFPDDLPPSLPLSDLSKGIIIGILAAGFLVISLGRVITIYEEHYALEENAPHKEEEGEEEEEEEEPYRCKPPLWLVEEIAEANYLIGIAEWELDAKSRRIEHLEGRIADLEGAAMELEGR